MANAIRWGFLLSNNLSIRLADATVLVSFFTFLTPVPAMIHSCLEVGPIIVTPVLLWLSPRRSHHREQQEHQAREAIDCSKFNVSTYESHQVEIEQPKQSPVQYANRRQYNYRYLYDLHI